MKAPAKPSDRRRGIHRLKMLVVVDATAASQRVLQYVGRVLAGRDAVDCCLAYITPGIPPALLESGGAELPEREEQIEAGLRLERRRWTAMAEKKATQILRAARTTLRRAGVMEEGIHTRVSAPLDAERTVDEVLFLARDEVCSTVVVGHRAHTWFRGLGGGHLAEQLVRRAKGLAVWVID